MPAVYSFCPSCGGNVECDVVVEKNRRKTVCRNCKFLVSEKQLAAPPPAEVAPMTFAVPDASSAPTAATAGPATAPPRPAPGGPGRSPVQPEGRDRVRTLGVVLSAEDIPALRLAIQKMLVSHGIAKQVVSTENGFDALVAFHQAIKNKVKLDLLVLDVNMPILDGINLAVCIRAVEKAHRLPPHPILFFTSNLCDDPFRRALEYLTPARYMNKGQGASAEEFGGRLVTVVQSLLQG